MKKVLITGANGLLGCNLTRELLAQGYAVKILVRPKTDLWHLPPCEVVYGHVDKKEDVLQALAGCAIVVHAAAVTGQWNLPYATYQSVNVTGTQYIAEACMQYGVERLIFVSTAAVLNRTKVSSAYIQTKYLAEQYLLQQPLPVVIVRPSFMIGAYDSKPSSGQLIVYGLNKKILFYPPGGKNFIHVRDVCRGIVNTMEAAERGSIYLLANQNMTYKDFYTMMYRQLGRFPLMIRIPRIALTIGSWFGGRLNPTTVRLLTMYTYYERNLSFTYTPVEEAIREALAWFKKE